ncbi:MAG: metal-dependent hydrolase [Mariprofundus sp.]|nr:metal-dependent hydrolase [Mariprofundus sp.]
MDPLTHAISGAALARAFPKQPVPAKQLVLIILLAMAPDSDIVLRLISDPIYLQHHRGLTHSLLMLPLWGWLIFSLSSRQVKQNPTMPKLIGLALLLHISLDVITTYGTMLFAPISDQRISLDLLFIIDPLFSSCLLIPLLLGFIWKKHARSLSLLSFAAAMAYLTLAYNNQQQAIELTRKAHPDAIAYHALPLAFSPFHWQLIAEYPDYYARAAVNLKPDFPGLTPLFDAAFVTTLLSTRISSSNHILWQQLPAMHTVNHIDQLPGTAFYAWFSRFPVVLKQNQHSIDFGDLAFGAGAPGVNASFLLHIDLPVNESISKPRTWLVWRNERKSELIGISTPFNWLPLQ